MDHAVDQYGYFTFAIDRPGIGSSSVADPINDLQMPLELSVVQEMTTMVRNGAFSNIPYCFSKIVHVGHSFGSSLIYNLASQYPTTSDGLILTGFSLDDSHFGTAIAGFGNQIARLNQPIRFGNQSHAAIAKAQSILLAANETLAFIQQHYPTLGLYITDIELAMHRYKHSDFAMGFPGLTLPATRELPTGYLTWANVEANQFAFFNPGAFDPALLHFSETVKQPFAIGQVLTVGTGSTTAANFTRPVLAITGSKYLSYGKRHKANTSL